VATSLLLKRGKRGRLTNMAGKKRICKKKKSLGVGKTGGRYKKLGKYMSNILAQQGFLVVKQEEGGNEGE